MSDVYVAFVRDDQSYAEALAVALQGSGLVVSRSSSVVDAIGECAAIVVLWTPAAARSKLFVDAADRAFRSGKMVLARMGSDPLPPMFAGTEAHSLSRWSGDPEAQDIDSIVFHVDRLVSRARLASGTRPAQEPPAAAPTPRGVVHRFPSGGAATARARSAEEPQQRMDPGVARDPVPSDPLAEEAAFWRQIQHSNNPGDFYAYLERYGRTGTFAELAETRIGALSARAAPPPRQAPPSYPAPQYQQGAGPAQAPVARGGGFSMGGAAPPRPMPRPAPQPAPPRLDPHPARARVEAPTAPPRENGGGMRGLAFLIFLAVVGGGGYYAYQQFRGPPSAAVDAAEDWVPSASTNPADDGVSGPANPGDAGALASDARRAEQQSPRAPTRQASPSAQSQVEEETTPEPVFRTLPAAVPAAAALRPPSTAGDPEAAAALFRDVAPPPVSAAPETQPAAASAVSAPPPARAPSRPQWAQRASARDLAAAYPDAAARRQIEGRVVLDCLIGADLAIRCRATSETPSGYGFAAAALRVAQRYRSLPTMADGRPAAGERAIIAISFKPT